VLTRRGKFSVTIFNGVPIVVSDRLQSEVFQTFDQGLVLLERIFRLLLLEDYDLH
jgi:hypothetical protein